VSVPDFSGVGYLAGEAPDGLTTVVAVPVTATVQVLWRDPDTDEEHLVASTTSAPDGTWRITGLNHELEYVVRGIKDGWNDVTVVGAVPTRMDLVTATGVLETNEDGNGVAGSMLIEGGLPPYTVSVIDPLPYGLTPTIDYRTLTIIGTSDDGGTWDSTVRVTASNEVYIDIGVEVVIELLELWYPDSVVVERLADAADEHHSATGAATRSAMGASLSGSDDWAGGVLGPDGKIYGIPYAASDILIIDPVAGTATRSAMGASLSGSNRWYGGVLGPDGKIYGIPYGSSDILTIEKATGVPALPQRVCASPLLNKL